MKLSKSGPTFTGDNSTTLQNSDHVFPNLGRFVIVDVELNLPSEQREKISSDRIQTFWFRRQARPRPRQKDGGMRPAAGLGAFLGFMMGGPFGALMGAAATASAVGRKDTVGDAARTATKAAGLAWDMSSKALETVSESPVGDVLRMGIKGAEKIVDNAGTPPDAPSRK
jgi:hypothetical protein